MGVTLAQYLANPNVKAFLDTIAWGEGADYNTLYGGKTFSDFSKHPNKRITAGKYTSTAAGRYQFLNSTWVTLKARYGLRDFSPQSQDLGAVALLSQAGAIKALLAGDVQTAIARARATWPSLAGGSQQTRTLGQDVAYYEQAGGSGASSMPPPDDTASGPGGDPGGQIGGAGDPLGGDNGGVTLGASGGLLLLALAGVAAYYLFD